ncbi:MAG: hypothetical protein IJN55_01040 [Alistipes sp.]|nr:hypothetical protein [Alistipes sp.]
MKIENVVYYAIYPNYNYTQSNAWDKLHRNQAWCLIIKTYKERYHYGDHVEYDIINERQEISSFSVGRYEVIKFYTTGTYNNFYLRIEFKDQKTGNLYVYDLKNWDDLNLPISSVVKFLKELGEYESFDTYKLAKRLRELEIKNQELTEEIVRLKKSRIVVSA